MEAEISDFTPDCIPSSEFMSYASVPKIAHLLLKMSLVICCGTVMNVLFLWKVSSSRNRSKSFFVFSLMAHCGRDFSKCVGKTCGPFDGWDARCLTQRQANTIQRHLLGDLLIVIPKLLKLPLAELGACCLAIEFPQSDLPSEAVKFQ